MTIKRKGWLPFAADVAVLAALVAVFMLFHHILPTRKASLNIVPATRVTPAPLSGGQQEEARATPEPAARIVQVSAGALHTVSDTGGGNGQLDSYQADGVSVALTHHTTQDGRVAYHVADIRVDDITKLRTAFAMDTYGSGYTDTVGGMGVKLNAVLAVNGDYYGNSDAGVVARNGVIYRANYTPGDILCLYMDGTMEVKGFSAFSPQQEADRGLWQAWTFGPSLLSASGEALTAFQQSRHMLSANPRTVLGYYAPGHYAVLMVDGRGESAGLTLPNLSALCRELGFTIAYNLDGGKSSVMTFRGSLANDPAGGGRPVSDIIYIGEGSL